MSRSRKNRKASPEDAPKDFQTKKFGKLSMSNFSLIKKKDTQKSININFKFKKLSK